MLSKIHIEVPMTKNIFKTGKQTRPKTAVKGKRYLCAKCRKRSPKQVKTPAPWYCRNCLNQSRAEPEGECMGDKAKANIGREAAHPEQKSDSSEAIAVAASEESLIHSS